MYLPFEYFTPIAEKLLKDFEIKTTKVTSGIDKGDYTSRIVFPTMSRNDELEFMIDKFGTKINQFTRLSRKTKEESVKQMISDLTQDLYNNDRRKNPQYFSDIYKYYNDNKGTEDVLFKGTIGYDAYTYFEILQNKYNAENYSNKNNRYSSDLHRKLTTARNFKEFYYLVKQLAKEEWLNQNSRYTSRRESWEKDYLKVDTFKFDEDNIPEIAHFEETIDNPVSVKPIEIPITTNIENKGNFKIGYRSEFLKTPIIYGRERSIILANGEKHKALFAIVELSEILASHNENNFSNTENYPTSEDGRNINDRNYSGDINAQAKVISVSQNFEPEIIISTSATASGTPIISVDGIVVSGNNRTMSLKLAKNQNKEQFESYLKTLHQELNYKGYGFDFESIGAALHLKGRISLPGSSYNKPLFVIFNNPILVRIDYDFQSYTTDEMAKYNKSTKKSERPIDVSIKISQQLKDNYNCLESLLSLISEQEVISDLYNDAIAVKRLKTILIDCNLITENDISSLFVGNTMTENGKSFYITLLSSLVLDPKVLEISQNPGIKAIISNVVNAIIDLNKNKRVSIGTITQEVNNAIFLQSEINSTKSKNIIDFIKEGNLFETNEALNPKSVVLNYWLNQRANDFKKYLKKYNDALEDSLLPNMFGEPLTPDQLFQEIFVNGIPEDLKKAISLVFNNQEDKEIQTENTKIVDFEKNNANFEEKTDLEEQIATLKVAYKYNPSQETADLIATLEITLKYI